MIAADGDGWNSCSKRVLAADEDGAEMEQFVKGGNLAIIILPQQMCDTNILQMCAVAQMYKVVAAAEKERAGSFSVRWSRSRRS